MSRFSVRSILVVACVLAVAVPTLALGAGEGRSFVLGKRNPPGGGALSRESQVIANSPTYGTRQSNKRTGDGGGAIYGCRSDAGREPCIRANNLRGGRAFEFDTTGKEVGRIESNDATAAPFTTNATGTATGLNADAVDGRDGASLAAAADLLFARVNAGGALVGGRGATAAVRRPGTNAYDVTFNRDVGACSATVSPIGGENANKPNASVVPVGGAVFRVDYADNPGPTAFFVQVIC